MRYDVLKSSLESCYDGPYQVVERNERYFIVQVKDKPTKISIDRLKPALTKTWTYRISFLNNQFHLRPNYPRTSIERSLPGYVPAEG